MEHAVSSPGYAQLTRWFVENGGFIHPGVEMFEDAENGVHFRARRLLPESSMEDFVVCACPVSLTLSHLNVASREEREDVVPVHAVTGSIASQLRGHLPLNAITHFLLAEQRLLGQQSFWQPYVSCLPKEGQLGTPLYFSQDDLVWLHGTNLHAAVDHRRAMWEQEWKTGCDVLRKGGSDVTAFTW